MRAFAALSQFSALLFLASAYLQASAQHSTKPCAGPEESTSFESCMLQQEAATANAQLHRLLSERLKNPTAARDLRASQVAWERFRDATCQWQQAEYGGLNSISAVRCIANLTAQRVRYFEELP